MQEMNWGNHQYLTCENNIKMDLKSLGWIHLAQDMVQ
jgi:hypothetical protein